MSILEYISGLKDNKISLSIQNDELKVTGAREALTKDVIDTISSRKMEILRFFQSGRDVIEPVELQGYYSLSHVQKRLWILDQVVETKGLYNVDLVHEFRTVDLPAFESALDALIDRHEILRTTFHLIDGEPKQRVNTPADFAFKLLHKEFATDAEGEVDSIIHSELLAPFDLSVAALRATLFHKKNGDCIFVMVLHHIITDAWSVKVLKNDFSKLYAHYLHGVAAPMPLRIHYKDYCHWQNQRLVNGKLDRSRAYWMNRFAGELPSLDIPLDNKRDAFKSYDGASVSFNLPQRKLQQLMHVADRSKASAYMVVVALIKLLLYRYSNLQEDIIVGSVMAGRSNADLEDQVGFYSNVVALRTKIVGSDSFQQLLGNVKATIMDAYEHQDFPFDLIIDGLNLQHQAGRNPLFDVMVVYEDLVGNGGGQAELGEDIDIRDAGVNKFDLTFSFAKFGNDRLEVDINYNKSLFVKQRMVRMAEHLRGLISAVADDPNCIVTTVPYLSDKEIHEIVFTFNDTYVPYDLDVSIKALIEQRASEMPAATAVISKGIQTAFSELNERANQLAHFLIGDFGVKHGDYVGIMMGAGLDRIIGLLAIIKTGAAYVPIDIDFPADRIQYILNDTKLSIVLTADHRPAHDHLHISSVSWVPVATADLDYYPKENPQVDVGSDDIFAILYTSGSTGKPKGVLVPQKGLINRMRWLWEKYQFGPDDIIYQKTPFVFDVSIGELFMPLCFGAKLLVENCDTSQEILQNIIRYNVTYVHFSPTMLNNFLNGIEGEEQRIKSVRYVFASGEALLKETVHRFYRKFDMPLINLYGPTEASIEASYYESKAGDEIIPIGKPIANVHLYVVDKTRQLMPIGVPGEIAIGGVGVADGYLNQPDKTNDRFVDDPHSHRWRRKMYLTGDVGMWNEKGEVEFLGRQDNQISINGSRIELGEIESAILEHPAVKETAVLVDKDQNQNYHLIAYYVKKQAHGGDAPVEQSTQSGEGASQMELLGRICTTKDYAHQHPVDFLIEEQAKRRNEAVAVIAEGGSLSYRELSARSDKLASVLVNRFGIGRGDRVALLVERSAGMVVSLLAILKTGAAYVPLDNDYPEQRIHFILNDAAVNLVLSDAMNAWRFHEIKAPIVRVDETIQSSAEFGAGIGHDVERGLDDLCYICYTSGSTGTPKGVMIEHRSVVDYVATFTDYFGLSATDKVMQQASIAFDTSVEEIFPVLCAGGTLVVQAAGGRDVDALIQRMNEIDITILSTTPLVMNELNARVHEIEKWPRILISGGDELRPGFIDRLLERTKLYNTYGPTETTVCACFALVERDKLCNIVGIPNTNHKVYLLDEVLSPVATGAVGEIFIEGPGVARGYLNRELETRERFLPNPFGTGKLYKTGDLGRWTRDGLLEFCGRKDRQVKIKGYRIEPSEVDACIALFAPGLAAFTIGKADADNSKRLITYYRATNTIDSKDLRSFVSQHLPPFMVPDYFVAVDNFPTTSNGKVDVERLPIPLEMSLDSTLAMDLKNFLKKKLPSYMVPSFFRNISIMPTTVTGKVDRKSLEKTNALYRTSNSFVAPKTETERKLAVIWQRVLNRDAIGLLHNFFEVGGNSLKATQILSAIHREFGREVSLKDIFNNPTVEELARTIDDNHSRGDLLVELTPGSSAASELYFVPPILGSSTIFKILADRLKSVGRIHGIQYKGLDTETSFDPSIALMASRFCNEIRKVQKTQAITLLGYSMGVLIVFEMAKLLETDGYDVNLILIDRDPASGDSLATRDEVEALLEYELGIWMNALTPGQLSRVKKLVYHNVQLLNEHHVQGKIKGDILAIEAIGSGHEATLMEAWRHYTSGKFNHLQIRADHYDILDQRNLPYLSEWIRVFLT